jgi:16S rRNA (guanine527-N7)-methyltransferase
LIQGVLAIEEIMNKSILEKISVSTDTDVDMVLKIYEYLIALLKANTYINLTSITNEDEAVILHIEDSLLGSRFIDNSGKNLLIDIGSGCGFPGVALAIANKINTVLLDSSTKKIKCVNEILKSINISSYVKGVNERIEIFSKNELHKFQYVSARALASLPIVLELASPLLSIGGKLIAYKANLPEQELSNSLRILPILGFEIFDDYQTTLSDGITHRRIIVFKKVSEETIQLPRRNGLAQKRPLYQSKYLL